MGVRRKRLLGEEQGAVEVRTTVPPERWERGVRAEGWERGVHLARERGLYWARGVREGCRARGVRWERGVCWEREAHELQAGR